MKSAHKLGWRKLPTGFQIDRNPGRDDILYFLLKAARLSAVIRWKSNESAQHASLPSLYSKHTPDFGDIPSRRELKEGDPVTEKRIVLLLDLRGSEIHGGALHTGGTSFLPCMKRATGSSQCRTL